MAPVDVNKILKAFAPVLSYKGGILSKKEVPRLAQIIKKYSTKLVSKCIFCNILLATDRDILNEYLNCDGWDTINIWVKDAILNKNFAFLNELLKVLQKCPITIELLKKNDTPKLLKTISKAEDINLAKSAKLLRERWRKIILEVDIDDSESLEDEENKKRKIKDKKFEEDRNISKKLKAKDENKSLNKLKIVKSEDENSDEKDLSSKSIIKTAKIKLGKSRSIGVLEKNSQIKQPVIDKNKSNSFITKTCMLVNQTASTPTLPLNKLSKTSEKGIQIIEAQPLSATELNNLTSHNSIKHVIKESAGFMDALSSTNLPTPKTKKKRKIEKVASNDSSICSDNNTVSENNDFNISNHSIEDNSNLSFTENSNSNNKEVESKSPVDNEPEFLTFSSVAFDPDKVPIKGILCLSVKDKKRNIRWQEDDKIQKVKYFELDENERCNVYKQNFNEHRIEEMKNERNFMSKNTLKHVDNPGIELMPWKLVPIDLNNIEVFPTGINSSERQVQEERFKTVLPTIYLPGQKAECPQEPDSSELNQVNVSPEIKVIPLEDIQQQQQQQPNNQPPETIEPALLPNNLYLVDNQNINLVGPELNNFMKNTLSNTSNIYLPNNNFSQEVNVNQILNNNLLPNLIDRNQSTPRQQIYVNNHFTPNNNHHLPIQDQINRWPNWENSNYNHNHNPYNNHKNGHIERKTRNFKQQVCRFYAKSGNCKFDNNCSYLHQTPNMNK